jgi:hypothetical protein
MFGCEASLLGRLAGNVKEQEDKNKITSPNGRLI